MWSGDGFPASSGLPAVWPCLEDFASFMVVGRSLSGSGKDQQLWEVKMTEKKRSKELKKEEDKKWSAEENEEGGEGGRGKRKMERVDARGWAPG